MKSPGQMVFLVMIVISLIATLFFIHEFTLSDDSFTYQSVESKVSRISEFKQKNILDFFDERIEDVRNILKFDGVKNAFNEELVSERFVAKEDVYRSSKIISKEIENYLISNPEMTLVDLQNSLEFQQIAVQKIAGNGYSLIYDAKTGEILFHPNKEFVNNDIEFLKNVAAEFHNQSQKIIRDGDDFTEGVYHLLGDDDVSREKFAIHKKIPIKTGDYHEFVLASTVYIEDYKIIERLDQELISYLDSLIYNANYSGFYLIDSEGNVIYDHKNSGYLGINVFNVDNNLDELFVEFSKENSMIVVGPHFEEYSGGEIFFSVGSSIYEDDEFRGVFISQFPATQIYEILSMRNGFGEYGESYLVNLDGQLSSPIKFANGDILVQEILTENVRSCANRDVGYSKSEVEDSVNYIGERVLSNYKYVYDLCLVTEVLYENSIDVPKKENSKRRIIYAFFILAIIVIVSFYVKMYIDNRYIFRRRKKFKYLKLDNYLFNKISPGIAVFLGGILTFVGIFILWYFYGYLYPEIYEENVVDLIIIFLSFVILGESIKIKDLAPKNFLFIGAFLVIIERILEVVVQTSELIQPIVNDELWALIYFVRYVGFILIAKGYVRRFEK